MYYIDGNNLEANTHPKGVGTPQAERELIELIDQFANENGGRSVTLVFDGVRPQIADRGKLRIVYPTSQDRDADNTIIRLVTADPQRGNAIVVTGDRGLIQRVRALGAKVKDRIEFLNSIPAAPTETKPRSPSRREVDQWLQIFEIPPERADQEILPSLSSKEPPHSRKGKRLK